MPHWLIKAAVQRAISWLPASHKWNFIFQRYVTHSLELSPDRFEMRLDACRRHLEHFLALHPKRPGGFTVLEVGTGWFPVVPVGLFLCGADEVWSFDVARLLSLGGLRQMFARFHEYGHSGMLQQHLPRLMPERLARLREVAALCASPYPGKPAGKGAATQPHSFASVNAVSDGGRPAPTELLNKLNIHACIRGAQDTGLESGTINLFTSTGVLQYVPSEVIKAMLIEFKRLGSHRSIQSHYVNLLDQYSAFDRSISPLNFLQYSQRQWDLLNSPLFTQGGFQITSEINTSGRLEVLEGLRLAPQFRNYTPQDLLVFNSWIVAEPLCP
jgi:hypothetical protein